jgi:hypothetical protein
MQLELERVRLERDEFEQMYLREKVTCDERRTEGEGLVRQVATLDGERDRLGREVMDERERVANLQEVLEDFQNGEWSLKWVCRR